MKSFIFVTVFVSIVSAQSSIRPSHSIIIAPSSSASASQHSSSHHASHSSSQHINPSSAHSSHMMTSSVHPTTPKPTTTMKPTTTPKPSPDFEVTGKNGSCVSVKGKIVVNVTYMEGSQKKTDSIDLVKEGANVTGHCLSNTTNTSDMLITWGNNISVMFQFTQSSDMWFMSKLQVTVHFLNVSVSAQGVYTSASNDKLYQAPQNKSYSCQQDEQLKLNATNNSTVLVDFQTVTIQPFHTSEDEKFKNPVTCPASNDTPTTSSIVPIAVGCALAGLIVIVLIAYLIGRRKNSRGYQQV